MRILIVDDDPGILRLLARVLRPHGHSVLLADCPSGARRLALQLAALREPIDVIVVDVGLPEETGFELADHLLADLKAPPQVVFITGLATPEVRSMAAARRARLVDKGVDFVADIEATITAAQRR